MRNNVSFVHLGDSVYQLDQVAYSTNENNQGGVSGNIVPLGENYSKAYGILRQEQLKPDPRNNDNKQTHIFADNASVTGSSIEIQEAQIKEVVSYYRSRLFLYIILGILLVPIVVLVVLIVALIVDVQKNGIGLSPVV